MEAQVFDKEILKETKLLYKKETSRNAKIEYSRGEAFKPLYDMTFLYRDNFISGFRWNFLGYFTIGNFKVLYDEGGIGGPNQLKFYYYRKKILVVEDTWLTKDIDLIFVRDEYLGLLKELYSEMSVRIKSKVEEKQRLLDQKESYDLLRWK